MGLNYVVLLIRRFFFFPPINAYTVLNPCLEAYGYGRLTIYTILCWGLKYLPTEYEGVLEPIPCGYQGPT